MKSMRPINSYKKSIMSIKNQSNHENSVKLLKEKHPYYNMTDDVEMAELPASNRSCYKL